jgi:hypothetical protein
MRLLRILLSAALLITSLLIALPAVAQSQNAAITSPRDGAQLKDVVQIEGTATHGKFHHYELAWAPQNAEDWQQIAFVQNQITNGSLGTWDTTPFQPGVYRLRLRLVYDNDQIIDVVVNNLSINQGTPTPPPSPTSPAEPTALSVPTAGAVVATPTVVIVQPPASMPDATATAQSSSGTGSTTSGSPRTPSVQINFGSFGKAFCNGILYTFLLFVAWGAILAVRGIWRWVLRQLRTSTSTSPKG